jgi:hypothetical protein
MSWASQRRAAYGFGLLTFLVLVIGGPAAYIYFSEPATCTDGRRNQGESGVDVGGPCPLVDQRQLAPLTQLWARSFRVRDGLYNAVTYIHNPNDGAGVRSVGYRFGLYDAQNVLVAERVGRTFVMPGAITPIFEGGLETGKRVATRTQFEFTEPLICERLEDRASAIKIREREVSGASDSPRLTAVVENTSVADLQDVVFIASISDAAGNAFAASQTTIARLPGGARETIHFTWPDPFRVSIGSIDITAVAAPIARRAR